MWSGFEGQLFVVVAQALDHPIDDVAQLVVAAVILSPLPSLPLLQIQTQGNSVGGTEISVYGRPMNTRIQRTSVQLTGTDFGSLESNPRLTKFSPQDAKSAGMEHPESNPDSSK